MNVDENKRKRSREIPASSNLNSNVTALCSEKPLHNLATKKEKLMNVAARYEGNTVSAAALEGQLEDDFLSCANKSAGWNKRDIIKGHGLLKPSVKVPCKILESEVTRSSKSTIHKTSSSKKPAQPNTNYNVPNGINNCKERKNMYVRDSSYWTEKTGKTKCPLNYEPDSDYWSYPSSSECSYNHKGESGFEEPKFSDSDSE